MLLSIFFNNASFINFCFNSLDNPNACNVNTEPFFIPHECNVIKSLPVNKISEFLSGSFKLHKINT